MIRSATATDYEDMARLAGQLGYPARAQEIASRYERLRGNPDHGVFVATDASRVLGWAHVKIEMSMVNDPKAQVAAIVIDAAHRGEGIGKELMQKVEAWALERGLASITLRCKIEREDAHLFYNRLGFRVAKTSHYFEKAVKSTTP